MSFRISVYKYDFKSRHIADYKRVNVADVFIYLETSLAFEI